MGNDENAILLNAVQAALPLISHSQFYLFLQILISKTVLPLSLPSYKLQSSFLSIHLLLSTSYGLGTTLSTEETGVEEG